MIQRFLEKKDNTLPYSSAAPHHPPPTIWNMNTVIKEPEGAVPKHWPLKLETIVETNKPNPLVKPNPLPSSGPFRSEPATLMTTTVKIHKPPTIRLTRERAATIIQRAYRKHRLKKIQHSIRQKASSPSGSHSSRKSSIPKSREDRRAMSPATDIFMSSLDCQRGALFKDYLKEGSLFFPQRESVIVFGGIDPHSKYGDGRNTGRNIFRYNSELNQWDLVGELPQPRHHHAVAFLKGKVYLAGGTDPRDDEKGKTVVVGTVWSFDPVSRAWFKEKDMLTARKNFGLAVMNGKLFAVGGQDKNGRILSSVERYDPATGLWEYISSLNTDRTGASATKFNDTVWVAGGMTSSRKTPLTACVESYDPKFNTWNEQSSLRFPRCFGCLLAMNDVLYFIGGAGRSSEKERTTSSCNAIDIWNPKEQEWKLHFAMSIPRHGHAVAYLGTQILIIGGVTTAYLRALTDVECFCCERKTWVKGLTGLPVPLSGHGAVTLPPASLM